MNLIKICVDDFPPSGNQFLGKTGTNWKYSKIKKYWSRLIKSAIKSYPERPFKKAIVSIHYIFPDRRRRDPDNYSGKMLLDPLVEHGIIIDDSFQTIKLRLSAEVIPKVRKTQITVEKNEK